MQLQYRSAQSTHIPDCYLLRMADEPGMLAEPSNPPRNCLDLIFNDCYEDHGIVKAPTEDLSKQIVRFFKEALAKDVPWFVAQCQMGVGRSQAVIAACQAELGMDNSAILRRGSYNRRLYKLLMAEFGMPVSEPLVSIVVRVKYDLQRLFAFLLSMKRQRHENWEVIAVTDGPLEIGETRINGCRIVDERVAIIRTKEPKGRWGHPYRQLGIDAARGEYVGLQNDDAYLTPGFIEQLVFAMEHDGADLATCKVVHSYTGWDVTPCGSDLGSWIAKTELVRRFPWMDTDAYADARYLETLTANCKWAKVEKSLFVHN